MPKKYLPHQHKNWLELFEKGKSEKWIANNAKIDHRTVKRGIDEARRERNANAAQIELVKEALSEHKDLLLAVLDELRSIIVLPSDNLEIRTEKNGWIAPIPLTRATVRPDDNGTLILDVPIEKQVAWELIREHLKGDKLWRNYGEWKESVLAHMRARIDLKSLAEKLIGENTGLPFLDQQSASKTPYTNPLAVQIFYEVALHRALKRIDGTNIEEHLAASDDGFVRLRSVLAYDRDRPQDRKNQLLDALQSLYLSRETSETGASYDKLKESTDKTRRIIDEIALLRMLPGSCRVCRRLGIK